jgi:hypothetical protein
MNGKTFGPVVSIANDISDRKGGIVLKDFVATIPSQNARYLRIRAVNFGKIPSWHPGSGGDAWIFVDEIIVK